MKIKDLRFTYGGYVEVVRHIGNALNPTEVPVYIGYFATMPCYHDECEIQQMKTITEQESRIGKASLKIVIE